MSRSVDLFIDSPLSVDELGRRLAVLTRGSFRPGPDDEAAELQAGDITAELAPHRYVDDGALRLSRYRYALSTRFSAQGSLNDCPEVVFVRRVADLLRQSMETAALVVLDLQLRDPGPGEPTAETPADEGSAR